MDVSVIIPTYNRARYLLRALNSVIMQTKAVQEIIVVDNHSSDGTRDFVKDKFPFVKCILEKSRG